MKKTRIFLILLVSLCILLAAPGCGAETYVESNGYNPDPSTYQGTWAGIYLQVLQSHSGSVINYENRTIEFWMNETRYNVPCKPVSLTDLTGDGIPELLFLEASTDGCRGDLWIYSADGATGRCILYVPGITRLDYDDMLGFKIFQGQKNGTDTLVIRHYKYENEWWLRFALSGGVYRLDDYMTVQGDYSGEGDDIYIRNGLRISWNEYEAYKAEMESQKTRTVSEYFKADYSAYGFDDTYESAVTWLYYRQPQQETQQPRTSTEVYGLTVDKLATRMGPGTQYEGGGTYNVKGQYIRVLAKAYDSRNGIWWVKCVIPYHGEERIRWTGWKRFDHTTISLDDLEEEIW